MLQAPKNVDVAALPESVRLSPVAAKFMASLPEGPPLYTLSPEAVRDFVADIQQSDCLPNKDVTMSDVTLRCTHNHGQGYEDIQLRIVRPICGCETSGRAYNNNSTGKDQDSQLLPVVLYAHGGGWLLGDKQIFNNLIQTIAVESQAAVVFVDYEKSPEAEYPVALEQIYSTLLFISKRGDQLKLDPERIAIAGDSAGGNMATVVAMLAKERCGPHIKQQILLYPVTDTNFNTRSYWKFANGPWLTRDNTLWFLNNYQPDLAARKQPTISPLQADIEQLAGLPPALIVTAENDILRDEGEAYAHKLMAAGVEVAAFRCLGVIHDFAMLNGLADDTGVKFVMSMVGLKLRQVFSRDYHHDES